MSQLILSAHSGSHDAVAAVFRDYELIAAVQLERLTRRKSDGREHPDLAIDEVLSIAGATRKDVDVVCFSRAEFPTAFYRNIRGMRWLREKMTQKSVGIFFFAGHGEKDKDGALYFLPADFKENDLAGTAIDADILKKQVAGIPGRLTMIRRF